MYKRNRYLLTFISELKKVLKGKPCYNIVKTTLQLLKEIESVLRTEID